MCVPAHLASPHPPTHKLPGFWDHRSLALTAPFPPPIQHHPTSTHPPCQPRENATILPHPPVALGCLSRPPRRRRLRQRCRRRSGWDRRSAGVRCSGVRRSGVRVGLLPPRPGGGSAGRRRGLLHREAQDHEEEGEAPPLSRRRRLLHRRCHRHRDHRQDQD